MGGLALALEFKCEDNDVKDIVSKNMPVFYSDVLKAWYALQNKNNKNRNVSNVSKNTIIWCNANVRHRGKVLLFEEWIKAGIIYMKDIIVNDRFLNLGELANVVKSPLILFSLHKLINAIPKKWKEEIKTKIYRPQEYNQTC